MGDMKLFRHKITGKVESFPDTEFYTTHPFMELVEHDEGCVDCVVQTEVLTVLPKSAKDKGAKNEADKKEDTKNGK